MSFTTLLNPRKQSEFRNKVAISKIALVQQFTWPPAVGDYFGRGGISHQN
jgi:hypothetical protein